MPNPYRKFAFVVGEVSPKLIARSDLEKYDFGLKLCRNFTLDGLGGLNSRPGTQFLDYIQDDDEPARLVPFVINDVDANTYMLVFSKDRVRFMQNGGYVTEAAQTIGSIAVDGTITLTAHGFSDEDWVKIGGRTMEVAGATTNTFTLVDTFGTAYNASGSGATTVARIYTVASPYATADLKEISFSQRLNELFICHPSYQTRLLTRTSDTSWAFSTILSSPVTLAPASVTLASTANNSIAYFYGVTAVDRDGVESHLASTGCAISSVLINFSTTNGQITISWPAVAGAESYRVYRSLEVNANTANLGMTLGFIGETFATYLIDRNITPDFTVSPPIFDNPFAEGGIDYIEITAPGASYAVTDTVTVAGATGSGFNGVPIVSNTGTIVGVRILNPGFGYTSPVVTFGTSTGSGATATATLLPADGLMPGTSAQIQQRRVYAGSRRLPTTLFGSRLGEPLSFRDSGLALASDPYILTLDQPEATPIRHIQPYSEGMFLFAENGLTQVRGADDGAIRVDNARAIPQTNDGVGILPPLSIDREFIYLNREASAVKSLRPSNLPTYFVTADISEFSEHLFSGKNPVISWTWAKAPDQIIWAVRQDGTLLSCTFLPNQNVYAWARHTTKGMFEDVAAIYENEAKLDRVYAIVCRNVDGAIKRYIEYIADNEPATVEDMWAVDSGLSIGLTYPQSKIRWQSSAIVSEVTQHTYATIDGTAPLVAGDVGKVIRIAEGKGTVLAVNGAGPTYSSFTISFTEEPEQHIPELGYDVVYREGEWSLGSDITAISGLWHLEGQAVEVLADGVEVTGLTVSSGAITLPAAASKIVVGLGFTGEAQTLPPSFTDAVVESRELAISGIALRLYKTRGLTVGNGVQDYAVQTVRPAAYDGAPGFNTGISNTLISVGFDTEGTIVIKKSGPLTAKILGYVADVEVGED